MKTYRLIKTYPGSPKLGTILTHEELQYCNWRGIKFKSLHTMRGEREREREREKLLIIFRSMH